MNYEELLIEATEEGISVDEDFPFDSALKGLYIDKNIALSAELHTSAEKACILAEELGHHYTTVGDILDQTNTPNRKQEYRARVWAYRRAISLSDLISGYKRGCQNRYELAEYLNVTEEFLIDALAHYKSKYGLCTRVDNYLIYFEPLGVLEMNM